jgi:tetratricopeptide (TPR) repeat protein
MKINGHTDNVGNEEYNMRLSKKRTLAVYSYLCTMGIPADRLSYAFYGNLCPIDSNDTEEGRANNRRVEFEVINTKDSSIIKSKVICPNVNVIGAKGKTSSIDSKTWNNHALHSANKISLDYYKNATEKLNSGQHKDAIEDYTKAIYFNPDNEDAYNNRGVAYERIGCYRKALNDFKMALKINPDNKLAKNNKVIVRSKQSKRTIEILNIFSAALNSVNSINDQNSSNQHNSSINNHTLKTNKQICTFCKGTGKNANQEYGAEFGNGHSYKDTPCNICGSYTNHYHKTCIHCKGLGYVKVSSR